MWDCACSIQTGQPRRANIRPACGWKRGVAALRGGSVAGDHQVIFATEGERIEIGHRAENRTIFARGAVKGAQWLIGQSVGRYDMKGVLGL